MIDLGAYQIRVDGTRGMIATVGKIPADLIAKLKIEKSALLDLVGHRSIKVDQTMLRKLRPAKTGPGVVGDSVVLGDGSELWRIWSDGLLVGSYDDQATADDEFRVVAAWRKAQDALDAAWGGLSEAERVSWDNYCAARLRASRGVPGAAQRAGVDTAPRAAADAVRVATMDRLCRTGSSKVSAGLLAMWHADRQFAAAARMLV